MGAKDNRRLDHIDTAPVAGIAEQTAISALPAGTPPRGTYFDPARVVPVSVRLSRLPARVFDLWGNEIPLDKDHPALPVTEAPVYALYDTAPENLHAHVTEAVAPPDPAPPALVSAPGRLLAATTTNASPFIPDRLAQMLPALEPLPLAQAVERPKALLSTQANLDRGESIGWILPPDAAGGARIVLSVRGGAGFLYKVTLNGHPVPVHPWPAWPDRELGRGKNWVELASVLMSEPLALKEGDKISVTATQGNSRLYRAWLLPAAHRL